MRSHVPVLITITIAIAITTVSVSFPIGNRIVAFVIQLFEK